jgi:hypothetical protein
MLVSGLTFFVLSSDYRVGQINEFYYLAKLLNVSYSDFLKMPVFFRKYLLDKWVKENTKD